MTLTSTVPGFGAPRFDPVGSWPSVTDRAVIGTQHFFPWWACFNVLFGVLVGLAFARGRLTRPALVILFGLALMAVALLTAGACPIIKNLWTSSFALFSSGFTLTLLGLIMPVSQVPAVRPAFWPARTFGENPLLAYILCFLLAPLIDANWFGTSAAPRSLRVAGQTFFEQVAEPPTASLLFALCGILLLLAILVFCHRRRWILKL